MMSSPILRCCCRRYYYQQSMMKGVYSIRRSGGRQVLVPSRFVPARTMATVPVDEEEQHHVSELARLRDQYSKEIESLPEQRAYGLLDTFLQAKAAGSVQSESVRSVTAPVPPAAGYRHEMSVDQINVTLDAALATFCLHVESRIAALVGQGFYTIGPCGEEALSAAGQCLRPEDSAALHYRHLGINLARQLSAATPPSMEQLLLERARGYTVSRYDPVTGGVHCSIGSATDADDTTDAAKYGGGDYIVTSTLASQCPPAVGRALGYAFVKNQLQNQQQQQEQQQDSKKTKKKIRPVSLATLGDGSVHNHHFWSAFHLARHAKHRNLKCPVLFGISDNGLSISYETRGYVDTIFDGNSDLLVPVYRSNGRDMMDVYDATAAAVQYSRKQQSPAVLLYKNLIRRFGHAATDRQSAYLEQEQIESMAEVDLLESMAVQAVEVHGATTYSQVHDRLCEIRAWCTAAFETAAAEEKVTRSDMMDRVSAPLVQVPRLSLGEEDEDTTATAAVTEQEEPSKKKKREVMRKHMTRVMQEILHKDDTVVYLGEDVEHGGYYLVTEGLVDRFPGRVVDFPPDETSLLGAAAGFAQTGITPIVEIPYAKYLDCGADQFYEIAIQYWLSAGQRPTGMVIRCQGFDRGVFGGNFHTHNQLQHIPPGIDVVCYSNGADYVRGFRHAVKQAKAGRVVMTIDSTNLLNLRHLHGRDRGWETVYPDADGASAFMGFDDIRRYGTHGRYAVVTYGNGVVTALQARKAMMGEQEQKEAGGHGMVLENEDELDIIDCPMLSAVPAGLREVLPQYDAVLFADICKDGPGSTVLSGHVCDLQRDGLLPGTRWDTVAAPRTYNPLGNTCTFLNTDDVVDAVKKLIVEG